MILSIQIMQRLVLTSKYLYYEQGKRGLSPGAHIQMYAEKPMKRQLEKLGNPALPATNDVD